MSISQIMMIPGYKKSESGDLPIVTLSSSGTAGSVLLGTTFDGDFFEIEYQIQYPGYPNMNVTFIENDVLDGYSVHAPPGEEDGIRIRARVKLTNVAEWGAWSEWVYGTSQTLAEMYINGHSSGSPEWEWRTDDPVDSGLELFMEWFNDNNGEIAQLTITGPAGPGTGKDVDYSNLWSTLTSIRSVYRKFDPVIDEWVEFGQPKTTNFAVPPAPIIFNNLVIQYLPGSGGTIYGIDIQSDTRNGGMTCELSIIINGIDYTFSFGLDAEGNYIAEDQVITNDNLAGQSFIAETYVVNNAPFGQSDTSGFSGTVGA